jgi:hypothetical protein
MHPFDDEWPSWDGPTPPMEFALGLVQADLDAAGLDRFRLSYEVCGTGMTNEFEPEVNVVWRGTWAAPGVDLWVDDPAKVTANVAAHTAQGMIELEQLYWPICADHGIRARAVVDTKHRAVWQCAHRGSSAHPVAVIGELGSVRPHAWKQHSWWGTLDQLASP